MEKINVQVYGALAHTYGLPKYETEGASGMDIRANRYTLLQPGETVAIPTGLWVAVPDGFEIQVRPRSGLSLKTGLRVANAPGTIDSDYRGECCIIVTNTGTLPSEIHLGERIAQFVLQRVPQIEFVQVNSLDELGSTGRGVNGFGSTGSV